MKCSQCGKSNFREERALSNECMRAMNVYPFVCEKCGHVEWITMKQENINKELCVQLKKSQMAKVYIEFLGF